MKYYLQVFTEDENFYNFPLALRCTGLILKGVLKKEKEEAGTKFLLRSEFFPLTDKGSNIFDKAASLLKKNLICFHARKRIQSREK